VVCVTVQGNWGEVIGVTVQGNWNVVGLCYCAG